MKFIKIVVIFPILLSACASGPKRENKSVVDYFNQQNYEATATFGGVIPIAVERKNALTVISGNIYLEDGIQPLKYSKVILTKGLEVIADGTTNNLGEFVIKGVIPNGRYRLEVVDKESEGLRTVQIESYELKNQDVVTHKRVPRDGENNR